MTKAPKDPFVLLKLARQNADKLIADLTRQEQDLRSVARTQPMCEGGPLLSQALDAALQVRSVLHGMTPNRPGES